MNDISATVTDDFIPCAEELESYYLMLEVGTIPELQWKFPGRRPIESPIDSSGLSKLEPNATIESAETQEPAAKNDFDFSDDLAQQPQLRVRNQNTPKSAKKKTANFAGVLEVLKKKNAEGS